MVIVYRHLDRWARSWGVKPEPIQSYITVKETRIFSLKGKNYPHQSDQQRPSQCYQVYAGPTLLGYNNWHCEQQPVKSSPNNANSSNSRRYLHTAVQQPVLRRPIDYSKGFAVGCPTIFFSFFWLNTFDLSITWYHLPPKNSNMHHGLLIALSLYAIIRYAMVYPLAPIYPIL